MRALLYDFACHIFGKEALDQLAIRQGLAITVVGPGIGFIADVTSVFGPVSKWIFCVCLVLLLLLCSLQFVFRRRQVSFSPFTFYLAAIVAALGVVWSTQVATATSTTGILAGELPAVASLQDQLVRVARKLDLIEAKTDTIAQDTKNIHKTVSQSLDRLTLLSKTADDIKEMSVARNASEKGDSRWHTSVAPPMSSFKQKFIPHIKMIDAYHYTKSNKILFDLLKRYDGRLVYIDSIDESIEEEETQKINECFLKEDEPAIHRDEAEKAAKVVADKWRASHPGQNLPYEMNPMFATWDDAQSELSVPIPQPLEARSSSCSFDITLHFSTRHQVQFTSGGTGIHIDIIRSHFQVAMIAHGAGVTFELNEVR